MPPVREWHTATAGRNSVQAFTPGRRPPIEQERTIMKLKASVFAIVLTLVAVGAVAAITASVMMQPAVAGDSDSGDGTGGGSGATNPP